MNAPPPTAPPRRWPRVAVRLAVATLGLFGLALLATAVLLGNLQRSFVKGPLTALIRERSGVTVDYADARVRPGGVQLSGLVVDVPEVLRAEVGTVEVGWRGARTVRLQGVVVTVPSPSRATPEPTRQESGPKQSLAKTLRSFLSERPPIDSLDVADVTVVLDRAPERWTLRGLGLHVATAPWSASVGEGATATLLVERTREGRPNGVAHAELRLRLSATPEEAKGVFELRLVDQSFAPELPTPKRVASFDITARLMPSDDIEVRVSQGQLADGALRFESAVRLPGSEKRGAELMTAQGEVDLRALVAAVPTRAPGVGLREGRVEWHVTDLVLGPTVRFGVAGDAWLRARLAGLALEDVQLEALTFGAVAKPAQSGALDLTLTAEVPRARFSGGSLRGARIRVPRAQLALDTAVPEQSLGELAVEGELAELVLGTSAATMRLEGTRLEGALRLGGPSGTGGLSGQLKLPIARARYMVAGATKVDGPIKASVHLAQLLLDLARPAASRAKGTVAVEHGGVSATLGFEKAPDAVDFTAAADARSLALLKPLVGPAVRWDAMGLSLRSKGSVTGLSSSPMLEHTTELLLSQPASSAGARPVAASELGLRLRSRGDARKHGGEIEASVKGLRVGEDTLGDSRTSLHFALDATVPSLALQLTSQGAPDQTAHLEGALSFDRKRKRVTARFDGKLFHPVPLAPLLAPSGIDPEPLEVELAGNGTVDGVLAGVDSDGTLHWAPNPLASLVPEGTVRAMVKGFSWARGEQELNLPDLSWRAEVRGAKEARTLRSEMVASAFEYLVGDHSLSGAGLSQRTEAAWEGPPGHATLRMNGGLHIETLAQDYQPAYPMRDVQLSFEAKRDTRAFVQISNLSLENAGGGTAVKLKGALDLGSETPRIVLRGDLSQDLAKLSADRARYVGDGLANLSLRVSSGNLRAFRVIGTLEVKGGNVRLPASGVELETIDGEVPINADVAFEAGDVRLSRETRVNPYPQLRFSDQHPLLSRRSFLSIAKVTTPWVSIAPLAGNLAVSQNVVSLSQLEMGVRGGRVTGQCLLDWNGPKTTLQAHVRASDLRSSHGEPFDGNIALVFSARDRGVDGRADILRIGGRHLQDLLDLQDPHHSDPAFNRVRRALAFGYPDRVRLSFNHGFASAKVTFGGLAQLVNVDEIRGIPVGPLVDRVLAELELEEEL